MLPIIFIQTHPIQYAAPLFKEATEAGLPIEVWFCSDESIRGAVDKKFGQVIKWDIPLLDGYKYRFFSNQSWKPSVENGFFGLMNFSMINALRKAPKSLVIVPGWNYATTVSILIAAKWLGHQVAVRGESPLSHEYSKTKQKQFLRRLILKSLLFKRIDYALYIGEQNKQFYEHYGVKKDKLKYTPYCVDNKRFDRDYQLYRGAKNLLRAELGLSVSKKIILYSGKFITKKRPMDILRAFQKLADQKVQLVLLGDGILREQLESYINDAKMEDVVITGFVNQSKITKYYAAADIFVMCSGIGETWGLSVNEAMNFNLPVIVSDLSGCSVDLVKGRNTGLIFKSGNIDELAECLRKVLITSYKDTPKITIGEFSYTRIINTLKSMEEAYV